MSDLQCAWQEPAILGEGPLWVERENAIYWVDIVDKKVHRLGLVSGSRKTWRFEAQLTSLAARAEGGFIATARHGYVLVNFETNEIKPLVTPEADMPQNRFNDGKLDAKGRYWGGTMDEAEKHPSGTLYRLNPDWSLEVMDRDYIITNGPTFSPDGKIMYHTETAKRTIYAFDLAEDGSIGNKREFVRLQGEDEGYPDGMTADSEGCVWLCHFGGSRITRYSPQGEALQIIPMPVPNVTCCTFGGQGLDTLYITTARYLLSPEQVSQYPLAGSLFSCKPGVTGMPTPYFPG